jgi:hypothetical protein
LGWLGSRRATSECVKLVKERTKERKKKEEDDDEAEG